MAPGEVIRIEFLCTIFTDWMFLALVNQIKMSLLNSFIFFLGANKLIYFITGSETQTSSMTSSLLGASIANCGQRLPFLGGMMSPDHRLNSINNLRLKAKEQMEIFKESCFNN